MDSTSPPPMPQSPYPEPRRFAPPTMPGAMPAKAKVWPQTVGIISIVIGTLGCLFHICSAGSNLLMGSFATGIFKGMNGPHAAGMDAAMKYAVWIGVAEVLALFCSIMLLMSGIFTLKRERRGATWHPWWAWARCGVVVITLVLQFLMQNAQFGAMAGSPGGMSGGGMPGAGMMRAIAAIGVIINLCWMLAYPVFILVWFSRPGVKADVAEWRT